MLGLSSTYGRLGILQGFGSFEAFVRGFNKTYPSFEIVDAGNEKECADVKIKGQAAEHAQDESSHMAESLEMAVSDVHCHHIIFGGSADNGYARQLLPHSIDNAIRDRITLIDGPKAGRAFGELSERIRTERFDSVFRSERLDSNPQKASPLAVNNAPPPQRTLSTTKSPNLTKELEWSTVAAVRGKGEMQTVTQPFDNKPELSTNGHNIPLKSPTLPSSSFIGPVCRNAQGQRVDAPLRHSQTLANEMKTQKYCNDFHLADNCHNTRDQCSYLHGPKLDAEHKAALRYVARQIPCGVGLECADRACFHGHCCPWPLCNWGSSCRFPKEMHGLDRKIAGSR